MSGIIDRLRARLPAASVRVIGIVIPVAVDGEVLVGGAAIGRTPGEQRARSHKAPFAAFGFVPHARLPGSRSPQTWHASGADACSGRSW